MMKFPYPRKARSGMKTKSMLLLAAMSAFVLIAKQNPPPSATAAAGTAIKVATNRQILATLKLAPFNEITKAATTFGAMIEQPILPAMALGSAQQGLLQSYGAMRSDAPIEWAIYADIDALKKGPSDSDNPLSGIDLGYAMLYPIAGDEAAFIRSHVGSKKLSNGVIKLLAGGKRADETFAKFTPDGKYCAFSSSADIVLRSVADYSPSAALPPSIVASLVFNERGAYSLAMLQNMVSEKKRARTDEAIKKLEKKKSKETNSAKTSETAGKICGLAAFQKFADEIRSSQGNKLLSCDRLELNLGLDERGFLISSVTVPKKGTKPFVPEGTHLPSKAFDVMAPNVFFAFASNLFDESKEAYDAFHVLLGEWRTMLKDNDDKELAKYKQSLDDLIVASDELCTKLAKLRYDKNDWTGAAVSFDAQRRHAVSSKIATEPNRAKALVDAFRGFEDSLYAIMERQWPGNGVCKKIGDGEYLFNWERLIDFIVKEFGGEISKKDKEELAEVKKAIKIILGGSSSTIDKIGICGDGVEMLNAAQGREKLVCAPSGQGAARFFAAMPEANKDMTSGFLYLTPYAFVHDVLLPIMVKCADKEDAKEYQAMSAAMPPVRSEGAFVGARWSGANGAEHSALRITADEIRSIGAAVNAINAAQSAKSSTAGGDDGDDDDD